MYYNTLWANYLVAKALSDALPLSGTWNVSG